MADDPPENTFERFVYDEGGKLRPDPNYFKANKNSSEYFLGPISTEGTISSEGTPSNQNISLDPNPTGGANTRE